MSLSTTEATIDPITARVRTFIARDRDAVFDYFVDLRNEPEYNGQVSGIRKSSDGPIGQGTLFEGAHRGLGRVTWRVAEYERPRHVAIEGGVGQGAYRWTSDFEPADGGTWMTGRMEWQPTRPWRLLRPLLRIVLQLNARRSFGRMARVLQRDGRRRESKNRASATRRPPGSEDPELNPRSPADRRPPWPRRR